MRAPAVLLMLLATGCGSSPPPAAVAPPPAASPSRTVSAAASPTAAPATTPVPSPTVVPRTAAGDLAAFVAEASAMDAALRDVAKRVNAEIGVTTVAFTQATVAAIEAIDPARAAAKVPAGMDEELLRAALLVYGDLAVRRAAFNRVVKPIGASREEVLRRLGNGAAAAARFAADLAALRTLAASQPALAPVPVLSRATAEVAARAEFIRLDSNGCASCGGKVPTSFAVIHWHDSRTQGEEFEGHVESIPFTVRWARSTGWKATLEAC